MANFNIDRMNNVLVNKLGEKPIKLVRTDYPKPIITNDYLVDKNGKRIGTKGDAYAKDILDKILQNGCLDYYPRPKYEDFYENAHYNPETKKVYTKDNQEIDILPSYDVEEKENGVLVKVPAHTLSVNNVITCSYDCSKDESPIQTLRNTPFLTGVREIAWIYYLKSNDLVEFDELIGKNTWEINHKINNWWRQWAIKNGLGEYILNEKGHPNGGACYGGTIKSRDMFQRDVIDSIKNNPDGRRHICSLWQFDDFQEPHALKPCAFLTIWNVRREWDGVDYLDMKLVQRSSDFIMAGAINQSQYMALLMAVAREVGLQPGIFTWSPANVQIYDRHIETAIDMLNTEPIDCKAKIVYKEGATWKNFKPSDFKVEDYPRQKIKQYNLDIAV